MSISTVAFGPVTPFLKWQGGPCRRGSWRRCERRTPVRSLLRAPISMCQPATGGKSDKPGVNVSKYASQRSIISAEKDVTPKEINELLVRAGKPARDTEKWKRAIEHSYVLVTAKLLNGGQLVGFARATSDRALNGTIWDLVTDPGLPDQATMSRNIISYLLREIRRTVPTCSVALCAEPDQIRFFEGMDFVAEPDGIAMMQISPDYQIKSKLPEQ